MVIISEKNEKKNNFTTIQISKSNRNDLKRLKQIPREPYDSVIERLIKEYVIKFNIIL